ncbi:MAG: DPP IV N-terminal domain-containing protein, partial [Caulobacter sp.]
MRRPTQLLLVSLLALAAASPMAGVAAVREAPQALFTGRDLFGLEVASDPQIRPDGDLIAYVRATNDIMVDRAVRSIWLVDAKTGVQTPLVAGPGSAMSPRWSPDGQRLAYVQVTPDAGAQIYVQWVATGRSARVATLEEAPRDLTWSPDGKTLAFTMLTADDGAKLGSAPEGKPDNAKWAPALTVETRVNFREDGEGVLKPGYSKIYAVSAEGGAPRQLTFGKFDDRGPLSFTKDGRYLLFSANRAEGWERDGNQTEIWRLALADGSLKALTSRIGPDANPVVSPDGRQIAYVGYDDARRRGYENQRLYVMDVDGGNSRVLTPNLDRSAEAPFWSADGRSLYFGYDEHGVARVARVGLFSGEIETIAAGLTGPGLDRPYSGGQFTVARDGTVAFTQGSTSRPSDVAVVKKGGEA